jgi:membrane associated rhomboid family serine protease
MYDNRVTFASPFTRPPPATLALMVSTLAASVVTMAASGWTSIDLPRSLLCVPLLVIRDFKVWTPLTFAFVELDPLNLLLYLAFGLWMFAAPLERAWGSRRLLAYFFATGTGTAVLMVLLSLVFPALGASPLHASYIMGDTIVLAWALMNWGQPVYFIILPVKAQHLLFLTIAFPVLSLLLGHVSLVTPVFLALGIGYLLAGGKVSPGRVAYQLKTLWLEWQLRRKARHLRVVVPDDRERERKRYLN